MQANGIKEYDYIKYRNYSTTVTEHYYKMESDLQDGSPLKSRFSTKTAKELLEMVKDERIRNARVLIRSDLSDSSAVKSYRRSEEELNKIEDYIKKKIKIVQA